MDADQIQAWAQSVGVSPDDEGFGIIALAYAAGAKAAFEEAAKVCESWGDAHVKKWDAIGNDSMRDDAKSRAWDAIQHAHRIRALAAREKEKTQ